MIGLLPSLNHSCLVLLRLNFPFFSFPFHKLCSCSTLHDKVPSFVMFSTLS
jgi:hypothetical protein